MKDAWMEVEHGRRQLDWSVALGDPEVASYLTLEGRQVMARMIDDLEIFLGVGWLHRAVRPRHGITGPTMGPYFASLMGQPAFVAAIGLWARFQYLVSRKTRGIGALRNNLRFNPIAEEFRHHIALARMAVVADLSGARVILEPAKAQGGPGDLRVVRGGADVFIEFRAIGPGLEFQANTRSFDEATAYLRQMESRYDVHWDGDLPALPTAEWREAVASAATRTVDTGTEAAVTVDGATLTARPGPAAVSTRVAGPAWEADQGTRLMAALRNKARQTQSAGAAWLWLEDAGALWPLSDFAREPFDRKAEILQQTFDPLFDANPHVLGVVLTSGEMRPNGPPADVTESYCRGSAFRRAFPSGFVRDSIVVHRRIAVPGQIALINLMCGREGMWLDQALAELGVAGGLAALLSGPTYQFVPRVPRGRRASGLIIP